MEKEEKNLVERPLMSEDEFKKYMEDNNPYNLFFEKGILNLYSYEGVRRFKSVRRAIRRGNMTVTGMICPVRPFHNRANTSKRKGVHSRVMNERKRKIYEQLKGKSN